MSAKSLEALFIISLPRAGSTLLQRMMTTHPNIASVAEPWLFLPFFRPFRGDDLYADFDFKTYRRALTDFCKQLPDGETTYRREIGAAALRMYAQSVPDTATYFLDKTPRYSLILPELLDAMPQAKFILLWRNPLAVAASMVDSFAGGNWNLHSYRIDLYEGLDTMCEVYKAQPDRFTVLRYEDLIVDPNVRANALFSALGMPGVEDVAGSFNSVKFRGELGDKTGRAEYASVSSAPLLKWKKTFANPLRKRWAASYLKWLGRERLEVMGYDYDALKQDIASIEVGGAHVASDAARMLYGRVEPFLNLNVLRRRATYLTKSSHPNLLQ